MFDRPTPPGSTSAADSGSTPPERLMRVAPLDLRQQKFRTVFRGLDRTEVVAFLTEAADDYEHALRDRLASSDIPASALRHLSMGMSHDFEAAVEEGATIVRVGTAIFGARTRPAA